jgi:hypothetical protein
MREKTGNTVDVAAVTAAWDEFFSKELPIANEELEAQGWKSRDDLINSGMQWRRIDAAVSNGKLEKKTFRVKKDKMTIDKAFFRPTT